MDAAPQDRVIVALDFPSGSSALALVDRLGGQARWFKVGLQLFLAEGVRFVELLRARGYNVFLDLKLHDIPNTVAAAVRFVSGCGASLLTVHAAGGQAMLSAAAEAAQASPDGPKLLAVTVLTSMDQRTLNEVGVPGSAAAQVERLARMTLRVGIPGLVCSPEEVGLLRRALGREPLLVVPGIRPESADKDDQSRTATPTQAFASGANMIVVGRPITRAVDPLGAFRKVVGGG